MMPKREAAFLGSRCDPFPINGLVLLLIIVFSAPTLWADEPSATPYRPTVSIPPRCPSRVGWKSRAGLIVRTEDRKSDALVSPT